MSTVEELHQELTGYISRRIFYEAQKREVEQAIRVLRDKEKIILSKLCIRRSSTDKSPLGRSPSPKHEKNIVCGKNGCKYTSGIFGIKNHRRKCNVPMIPCSFCGFMGTRRDIHIQHIEECKKKHFSSTEQEKVVVPTAGAAGAAGAAGDPVVHIDDVSFASSATPL